MTNTTDQAGVDVIPANQTTAIEQRQERKPMRMGSTGIDIQTFVDLWQFATVISTSGMAPKGITTKEAITVAIQMGLEVGLPPMAALQNIAVINGRPSIWGDAQLGIVRQTGQLERYEEAETNNASDLIFRELCLTDDPEQKKVLRLQLAKAQAGHNKTTEDFGVTVFVQRKNYEPIFNRFTVADSKVARLWGKEGPWTNYPARMLKFRARSFALRDQFGDALKGLLSAEEAQDLPPLAQTVTPNIQPLIEPAPAPVASKPKKARVVEPEQPAPAPVAAAPAPTPEPAPEPAKPRKYTPSKKEQAMEFILERKDRWGAMQALFVDINIEGADSAATADDFCNNMSEQTAAKIISARNAIDSEIKQAA